MRLVFLLVCIWGMNQTNLSAAPGRWERELSGAGWRLTLDHNAIWWNDDVFLPPVDVSRLPVNPPACGWDMLEKSPDKTVNVPGTVEEHYWGAIGGIIPDDGGDYRGVSWWSTTFFLPPGLKGKSVVIAFESVNLRAEVFVNRKLVGYDVIGNTQFEADATSAAVFGGENRLDVRITDPVGNFSWNDNILMRWGKNLIPAVHGFGGITGKVAVKAVDQVNIADIYVQNKPKPKDVEVFVTLANASGAEKKGSLALVIHEWEKPSKVVFSKTIDVVVPSGGKEFSVKASCPDARLWELAGHGKYKEAALYEAAVRFVSGDAAIEDSMSRRFGFRYFEVGEKNGDKRFYLNGKRVVLLAAMTRGFWPKNGIFATPEMAKRDMEILVDMGFNMMLLHRAIGQPPVMDYADRMGLFTYEEPGGYRVMPNKEDAIDAPDAQAYALRKEKLRRMVIRDRSCPSMIIYNLKNEARKAPDADDIANVRMCHELDPSRIVTYNSDANHDNPWNVRVPNDPYKLHMLPFDNTLHYDGWWDQHHWFAWAGYVDFNYRNPQFYLRGVVNGPTAPALSDSLLRLDPKEIIFWGEEGAFGTMVRLQKIKERLEVDPPTGFREMEHIDWFNHYDRFLDETGFRKAFPDVDALTLSMGRNLHYFQGRNIENVRMSNIADGYNMNGWGSASTRTDIVDMYRNPTADPSILAYYTRPLYVAVKLRSKVMYPGFKPTADFWIINEDNLNGKCTLEVALSDPDGVEVYTNNYPVNVLGGEEFGQLLLEGVELPAVAKTGYYMLDAHIRQNGMVMTTGCDDIYVADFKGGAAAKGAFSVIESDGVVKAFLKTVRGNTAADFTKDAGATDFIIVGKHDFGDSEVEMYDAVMKRVSEGSTLIVLDKADKWAERINALSMRKPPFYEGGGIVNRGNSGRLFVGYSPFLEGLPQAQSMGWEYQWFYQTNRVEGLKLHNWGVDVVAALGAQGTNDILKSLARVKIGKGQVILSTLDMLPALKSDAPQAAVPKRLFLNLIDMAGSE